MKNCINKCIQYLKLFVFITILNLTPNSSFSLENKIVIKIDNEIITSVDIEKETRYLLYLNPNTKTLSKKQIYKISKNSLIREKIKKKEIFKNFKKIEIEENILNQFIENMFNKIGLSSKIDFISYLEKNKLNLNYVEEKIKLEIMWNRLVYSKYKSKLKINSKEIRNQILKNQETGSKQYYLQEILFDVKENENFNIKYDKLVKNISSQGFEKTALLYSISNTSQNNGNIGWIKANSLNKNILNKIEKIKIGEITKPITIPGGFLLLKVLETKFEKENIDIEKEMEKIIRDKTNQQLNQHSLIFYNKIKKDIIINEL